MKEAYDHFYYHLILWHNQRDEKTCLSLDSSVSRVTYLQSQSVERDLLAEAKCYIEAVTLRYVSVKILNGSHAFVSITVE